MASATRKPPAPGRQPAGSSSRLSPTPSASTAGSATRPARRNTVLGGRDGPFPHRGSISGGSPLTARAAARRPVDSNNDAELENAALLEDLRSRLAKSESAAEAAAQEYTQQIQALQIRLDGSTKEQVKMEEQMHEKEELLEDLQTQVKDLIRSKRDQENIYEAERTAAQQEKEELLDREEELNTIIQRLKDTLAQREAEREAFESEAASIDESMGFAPTNRTTTPSTNQLVLAKDRLIESLRLELAEVQLRVAEADQLGGTKLQLLEQQLLEVRMTNARLMEDNESFQLLLSSAALNGDFPRGDYMNNAFGEPDMEPNTAKKVPGSPRGSMGMGVNLADELEGAEEKEPEEPEKFRKLEAEYKQLKEQNKAMSLYINNIIERILMHKDSEAILDKSAPVNKPEKPLPAQPKEDSGLTARKSLANRRNQPAPGNLTRSHSMRPGGHRRAQSEVGGSIYSGGIVGGMYSGMMTPRTSTFSGDGHYTSRKPRDSSASVDSGVSDTTTGELHSPSPPPQAGPIVGKQLRPLTLVQKNVSNGMMSPPLGGRTTSVNEHDDNKQDKAEKRSSKRGSWMGWFNRGKEEETPVITENVVFERTDVE